MEYNSASVEAKWKQYWIDQKIYEVTHKSDKPKYYVLDMFPYPSGAGLHVGHPLGYIASDIYSRYKRMTGFNVLHPMGFDAFGLPAEEYALQTGIHPATSTAENMKRYREQLGNLGLSYDWSRELATCDPKYYKWTQWIFTELYDHYYDTGLNKAVEISELVKQFSETGSHKVKAVTNAKESFDAAHWNGLNRSQQEEILMEYRIAYRKVGYVNWCEGLGTVLANDQVKDGISERGGHPVEQRAMTQWYLRITSYAERMLNDLDTIDWSDSLKAIQRNWIGRSEGASVFFDVVDSDEKIEVFTTRPDTIFGATYMVLAPEHDLVAQLTTEDQKESVKAYIAMTKSKTEVERMADKKVSGAFIGAYVYNPFLKQNIPIWIGEYVLKDYGTGAIMAVPSDDDRDHAFATKFGLDIIPVVDKSNYPGATLSDKLGVMINSEYLNGLEVPAAITMMSKKIEESGFGKAMINYKLRDANFSRQRYWGEPFPISYDKDGIAHTLPLDQLPLELPVTEDFQPGQGGKSPLSRLEDWVEHDGMRRETDVMPAVAGSSWYFLRFMDPSNDEEFVAQDIVNYWRDVDLYIGGSEHAVAHLMYARFWHKFLFDKGLVPTSEPFKRLVNQGMIQGGIEYIALLKEKENGFHKFVCSGLLDNRDIEDYTKIPVKIEFVHQYGSNKSYFDIDSIKQFIDWRSGYQNAIFECAHGVYHKGTFTPASNDYTDSNLVTISEIGKMSKSKFNVINPDEVIERYGADCFRMYEMFLGPIQQSKPWDTNGIDGVYKFLNKYWALITDSQLSQDPPSKEELKILHTAIKKVSGDITNLSFNTAVSSFMICVNELKKAKSANHHIMTQLTALLAPFAPFIAEEAWSLLGQKASVHQSEYPIHDEAYLVEDEVEYPICFNGKKRTTASFASAMSKDEIEKAVMDIEGISKWTDGKVIKKVIVVPNRMVNIVI